MSTTRPPLRAAHKAVYSPAAPAPTTATWVSSCSKARYGTRAMAPAPVFLSHPSSLEHDTGGHPEQPARIVAIERALAERGWLGFRRVSSTAVSLPTLTA